MHRLPEEELRLAMRIGKHDDGIDNQTALRLKRDLAEKFREQLTIGYPTREDEDGLRQLAHQLRDEKVRVKLFLSHPLHAKLYLIYRSDPNQSDCRLPWQQQPDLGGTVQTGRTQH